MLGLQADAPNRRLYVDPDLPQWLPDLTLRQLAIGDAKVDLRFWLADGKTDWDAEVTQGTIAIEQKSWQPHICI